MGGELDLCPGACTGAEVRFSLSIILRKGEKKQGLISMPDNRHLPGTFTECPIHFSCCRTMSGTPLS